MTCDARGKSEHLSINGTGRVKDEKEDGGEAADLCVVKGLDGPAAGERTHRCA